jgi:RNA polymerase sigma-70 factor (ECF subfamily)
LPDEIHGDVVGARGRSHADRPRVPREVLEGVRKRDAQALGQFFDAAFDYVYSVAFRLTGNRDAAEDVTQDVFVKLHRAAESIQPERDPIPLLTTITYNACRDAQRRSRARPEIADDERANTVPSSGDTPEEALLKRERARIVQDALMELDEQSRVVVVLHDYCGMSHEEVAMTLQTGAAGIRKRYSRGLKRLAQIIGSRDL